MSSIIEGDGTFKDYNGSVDGSPVFETQNKDEWEEYCKEKKLTRSGSAPCILCNTKVEFENLPVGKNAICESCKSEL
jgi:hypothetical protein